MMNYETITIEKGMYGRKGKTLTQVLEEMDPSESYKNTALMGMDAYQRQLKRFDIKVSGQNSDMVEKFFQTSSSAALFPEYVSRAVRQGIESADVLSNITAAVTKIDGMDYRSIASTPNDDDKALKVVGEGAYIPQTVVKTQENLVKLKKRGRMLVSTYEALRFQRLDLFTVTLRQIGAYIAKTQLQDAIDVILNGDGNQNAASSIAIAGSQLAYSDLIRLWTDMAPYELNTILAPTSAMQAILSMPEMQDAQAGLDFQGTGKMVTPMGATLIHVPALDSNTIIGLDRSCALELVQAGDIQIDYDKLIDRQLERAAISVISGFAKIFTDASKKLTL